MSAAEAESHRGQTGIGRRLDPDMLGAQVAVIGGPVSNQPSLPSVPKVMVTPIVIEIRRHGANAPPPAPAPAKPGIQVPRPRADVSAE
jgi:hypothetical protein